MEVARPVNRAPHFTAPVKSDRLYPPLVSVKAPSSVVQHRHHTKFLDLSDTILIYVIHKLPPTQKRGLALNRRLRDLTELAIPHEDYTEGSSAFSTFELVDKPHAKHSFVSDVASDVGNTLLKTAVTTVTERAAREVCREWARRGGAGALVGALAVRTVGPISGSLASAAAGPVVDVAFELGSDLRTVGRVTGWGMARAAGSAIGGALGFAVGGVPGAFMGSVVGSWTSSLGAWMVG
eukprot:TRINITY_DN4348_c2_g2_i1.p1 TRINITY_DN4348_c2_g2~~TRINITY_DN4348_c2_g2_i1.p1  ORF type:complete len:248 (+),score=52.72 TRINITY_DN4348_c2_g2_i1:36-746(+)